MDKERYKIVRSLGKGGMGEVFLAYDHICQREVALKKIRENLQKYPSIKRRFLREAHIAATLNHPSIIPIFSISENPSSVFYTMPFVEGKTLKEHLKEAPATASLMRMFLSICQAVAHCHSRSVLHRDLKPENIILGKFGEVMIIDWGLAQYIDQKESDLDLEEIPQLPHLTRPGKIVGTLAYLAPERAQNEPSSEQTDLYALGVILYQILTLKLPFKRSDLETFQKMWMYEELTDPIEAAPDRDIPHSLCQIVKKCLNPRKELRYQHVTQLIADFENFLEGKPEWILAAELKIDQKQDWEFQENILLAKHIAITGSTEVMEWVNLMISRASFSGNTKIEAFVRLGDSSHGIGLLMNVPEIPQRHNLMDGYCVWIGSQNHPGCRLFRNNIEVLQHNETALDASLWHTLRLEKTDSHLKVLIDHQLCIHYISHTPLAGTHIGLLLRDADLEIAHLQVFTGSQNITVSCLAIPDAFLANQDYPRALSEYRQIATSFPGRTEGREAIFRAGVTLLEAGLAHKKIKVRQQLLSHALEEFSKLRATAGAPLEYLGKSLVYKAMNEVEEEVKCLELAIRKYQSHPLLPRLVEHLIFRLHESSSHHRLSAYHFALLTLRHLPQIFTNPDHQKLIDTLKKNWEIIPFLNPEATTVYLAFFLARPIPLMECIENGQSADDATFALLMLGCTDMVKEHPLPKDSPALAYYKVQTALDEGKASLVLPKIQDPYQKIWALLFLHRWDEAKGLLDHYPLEELTSENSPLFPLFGCYLWATEGEAIARAHFLAVTEVPYPRTPALLGHFLTGSVKTTFLFEQMQLTRQLILFYQCTGDETAAKKAIKKLKKLKHVTENY